MVAGAAELRRLPEGGQAAGRSSRRMAEELNAAGDRAPHGEPSRAESVRRLRKRWGLGAVPGGASRPPAPPGSGRSPVES